jgi:hypothetical protein
VISGVTVVTTLVCFFLSAREAAGASSARHSLRPLILEGATFRAKLAWTRGEIAKLCLQMTLFEIRVYENSRCERVIMVRRPCESRDP